MSETEAPSPTADLKAMTSEIISAYVSKNPIAMADLPGLIQTVHQSLAGTSEPSPAEPEAQSKATPAQIRKSITPDALISFEDGRSYKTLKRHLSKRGLTIAEYKAKWGLPKDYPSTSPGYSARRSEMAKSLGLGRRAAAAEAPKPKTKRAPKAK